MLFYNKTRRITAVLAASALCLGMLAACGTASQTGEQQSAAESAGETAQTQGYTSGAYDNWQENNPVAVTLNGDSIKVDSAGAAADGSTLAITAAGVYVLSGTLDDGQILVEAGGDDTVQIVLNGANIYNSTGAAIYSAKAGKTVLALADGTGNTVSDGGDYNYPDSETDEPGAAIFSKGDLIITGTGALTVAGNFNNGIGCKDDLVIENGAITVTAANHGIRGRDSVTILDGAFSITAGNDGIQSNNGNDGKGWILLSGGTYDLQTANDGIQAESALTIHGGVYNITAGGGSQSTPADADGSYKGLKAGTDLLIEDGAFNLDCADDTVHANGNVTINGGALALASGDDGIHADQALTINDGVIDISTSYEGLEGMQVHIHGGTINLVASDDGINAAGGESEGGGRGPFAANENNLLNITGGHITVTASGDGIDSNGHVTMSGGTLIVNGPLSGGDAPLDFDGTFTLTGGTIIAAGSSGMAQAPGEDSTQPSLQLYFSSTQAAGTTVEVSDGGGNLLLTATPTKDYQNLVLSTPELQDGETYQVIIDGVSVLQVTLSGATTRISDSGEAVSGGMGMGGGPGGGGRGGMGGTPPGDGEMPDWFEGGPGGGGEPPFGERPEGRGSDGMGNPSPGS